MGKVIMTTLVAVSLSSDGKTVAIASRLNDDNGSYSGHVRAYNVNNTTSPVQLTQLGQDILDRASTDEQSGMSLSISSDGKTVAIITYRINVNDLYSDHVRVYFRSMLIK